MTFGGTIALSVLIGAVTGFVAARVIALVDDHLIELTITVVLAYGSYLLADGLDLSGVIATVTAAIVFGNVGPARQACGWAAAMGSTRSGSSSPTC